MKLLYISDLIAIRFVPLLFLTFLLMGCGADTPLKSYYFPHQDMVYMYTANDSSGIEYWHVEHDHDQIVTTIYTGDLNRSQKSVESVYSNGINLEQLTLFQNGELIDVEIKSGFVFPFEQIDSSEVVFYRIRWEEKGTQETSAYEVIRNRRFIGFSERDVFGDRKRCALFRLEERIISDKEGSLELNISGQEWYAEGIGLVYRVRKVTPDIQLEQKLLQVLTPEEFDKLSI